MRDKLLREVLREAMQVIDSESDSAARTSPRSAASMRGSPAYTPLQGQYLAFLHYYTKLNGRAPAEVDMQRYFKVSPPSVHQMVGTLGRRGFIAREPGQARSIRLLLRRDELPDLD